MSPILGYDVYKARALEMDEKLVGMTTGDGVTITNYTAHAVTRSLGYTGLSKKYQRGEVPVDTIKTLLSGKRAETNNSPVYRNADYMVSVNVETGTIIQANPVEWH